MAEYDRAMTGYKYRDFSYYSTSCKHKPTIFCPSPSSTSPTHTHTHTHSDQHGFAPLHYACMYGHGNIVEMFLMRGARTDITNMGGDSLLHMAAAHGKYDIIVKVCGTCHEYLILK